MQTWFILGVNWYNNKPSSSVVQCGGKALYCQRRPLHPAPSCTPRPPPRIDGVRDQRARWKWRSGVITGNTGLGLEGIWNWLDWQLILHVFSERPTLLIKRPEEIAKAISQILHHHPYYPCTTTLVNGIRVIESNIS